MKLLIVEDERQLSDGIAKFLSQGGYLCEQAYTVREALIKTGVYEYDCVLLDLMLPDGSGLKVLEKLKANKPETGVIIVSAKDSTEDIVRGIEIGADDYLPKPFNLSELAVRIFALLRRRYSQNNDNTIKSGNLCINLQSKDVCCNEKNMTLTKSEYELLVFLVCNRGKAVSKMAIAEHLSGDMADMMDNFNFVFSHIKNLKKKLEAAGCCGRIETLYGIGYKWQE